jgi:hypothetical protein
MKKLLTVVVVLFVTFKANAQKDINSNLKRELDSIYELDQQYRHLLSLKNKKDSIATSYNIEATKLESYLSKKMESADSSNLVRIEKIIKHYGYPGKSLVGTPTNEAVFFVIQHSPKIKQYFALIEDAAQRGELPFIRFAMMQDRLLLQEEREQLYGTQIYSLLTVNPTSKKDEWRTFVWPIKDPELVNEKRKQAGFNQTLEENALRFGIKYEPITIEDVKKMKGKN